MRKRKALAFALIAGIFPVIGVAATHTNKEVAVFHSPDSRPCTFFTLTGVAEADPVVAGNPWFSIPQTHIGYKEIISVLLAARTVGKTVTVGTAGTMACGHAAVQSVVY